MGLGLWSFILLGLAALAVLWLFLVVIPVRHWVAALCSGVPVGIFTLIGMRLRQVPPHLIVDAMIQAHKAGIALTTDVLEAHFLAGGNVMRVVAALVAADKANIALSIQRATAIDLAGRNVLEAVKMSVNPKVIETPEVAAMAKDGIQVKAIARVTVRANIDRLIGGAGEQTILARVGEGIVTTIGSASSHKQILENPDMISKTVLKKGLDSGTAFEILSIDIADVNVGKTSAPNSRPIRPMPTKTSPRRKPKNAVPWPSRRSRKCSRGSEKCALNWSRWKRRCRWPSLRPSAARISKWATE